MPRVAVASSKSEAGLWPKQDSTAFCSSRNNCSSESISNPKVVKSYLLSTGSAESHNFKDYIPIYE